MITVTVKAADKIKASAEESTKSGLWLRLAAKKNDDGSIEYGLGMDEQRDEDVKIETEGVQIIVAKESQELLSGCVLDYVEIEEGKPQFIFLNPNDPNYIPPTEGDIAQIPAKHGDN
ncbi:MAG: iron-sulfur cluster assembly accessory protein [Acidiferrobacterales bacterium]